MRQNEYWPTFIYSIGIKFKINIFNKYTVQDYDSVLSTIGIKFKIMIPCCLQQRYLTEVDILRTRRKHLHDCTISFVHEKLIWPRHLLLNYRYEAKKTSCHINALGLSILPLTTIFLLDFWTVTKVWYIVLFFSLLHKCVVLCCTEETHIIIIIDYNDNKRETPTRIPA